MGGAEVIDGVDGVDEEHGVTFQAGRVAEGGRQVGFAHHAGSGMMGKSCLAQALGHAALRAGFLVLYCSVFDLVRELQADQSPAEAQHTLTRYLKPDLLCIDDFGMKHFPPKSAESLLELIVRRHQNRSTLMTSNRPIEDWGQLLGDMPAATAILDRFLQQAEIIQITGRSYRLRNAAPPVAAEQEKNNGGSADKQR